VFGVGELAAADLAVVGGFAALFAAGPLRIWALVTGLVEATDGVFALIGWARNGIMVKTRIDIAPIRAIPSRDPITMPRVVRSLTVGPDRRNEDSLEASPGSSAASRRSISARMRCSSIDSAIAPYLRVPRASGNSLTIPHGGSFIQSF